MSADAAMSTREQFDRDPVRYALLILADAVTRIHDTRNRDVAAVNSNRASDQARIAAAVQAAEQAESEAYHLRQVVELLNARIDLLRAPSANKVIVRDGDGRIRAIKDEACAG